MSWLKRILLGIVLIVVFIVAAAYFLPRTVYVEKTARIEAPVKTVYAQVIDLHQWDDWSTWNQIDTSMQIKYFNHGVGVGAGYKWLSNNKNVGNGALNIIEANRFDSIRVDMEFDGQGDAKSIYYFNEIDGQTDLTWNLTFDVGNNPLMRWMGLMIKKSVGKNYETGLDNLNAHCKELKQGKEYIVLIEEVEAFTYASVREKVSFIEISLKMGEMFGNVGMYLAQKEVEMAGMPYSQYHLMNENEIDLECGIPSERLVESSDKVLTGTYPKIRCASVDFYGDYQNLREGHTAIQKWIDKHGFTLTGAPTEFYLTDPGSDPNPENWLTRICYPIE